MKETAWILLALVTIAECRPDVSHVPSSGYLPSNTYLPADSEETYHESAEEKHVYFYGASGDGYHTHFKINVVPKTKKNTKVIFVKAPHHAGVVPHVVAPNSLVEDKTRVYVLVKKPGEEQSVSIPAGLGIKQAKPEVFFIKYKNKHDAEHEIHKGIHGHQLGDTVPDLSDEHTFINTLGGKGHGHKKHGNGHGHKKHGHDEDHGQEDHAKKDFHVSDFFVPDENGENDSLLDSLEAPINPNSPTHTVVISEDNQEDGKMKHGSSGPY